MRIFSDKKFLFVLVLVLSILVLYGVRSFDFYGAAHAAVAEFENIGGDEGDIGDDGPVEIGDYYFGDENNLGGIPQQNQLLETVNASVAGIIPDFRVEVQVSNSGCGGAPSLWSKSGYASQGGGQGDWTDSGLNRFDCFRAQLSPGSGAPYAGDFSIFYQNREGGSFASGWTPRASDIARLGPENNPVLSGGKARRLGWGGWANLGGGGNPDNPDEMSVRLDTFAWPNDVSRITDFRLWVHASDDPGDCNVNTGYGNAGYPYPGPWLVAEGAGVSTPWVTDCEGITDPPDANIDAQRVGVEVAWPVTGTVVVNSWDASSCSDPNNPSTCTEPVSASWSFAGSASDLCAGNPSANCSGTSKIYQNVLVGPYNLQAPSGIAADYALRGIRPCADGTNPCSMTLLSGGTIVFDILWEPLGPRLSVSFQTNQKQMQTSGSAPPDTWLDKVFYGRNIGAPSSLLIWDCEVNPASLPSGIGIDDVNIERCPWSSPALRGGAPDFGQSASPGPAVCGNGVIETGEACDFGSSNGACPATCSAGCTINNCGDPTPPSVDLRINGGNSPVTVNSGDQVVLSWTFSGVSYCSLSGSWSGTVSNSPDSFSATLITPGIYNFFMTCGEVSDGVSATVLSSGGGGGGGGGSACDQYGLIDCQGMCTATFADCLSLQETISLLEED